MTMKPFATLLIMVSILVSALSIGGMTGGFAHMAHGAMAGTCAEVSCPVAGDGMQVTDCIGHCLSASQSAAPAAASGALLLLFAAVLFIFGVREPLAARREPPGAFSSFIGTLLLRQRLSTVVLRN